MWPCNARIQHTPSYRRQEEVVRHNNPTGLQMQLSIFYTKTGTGNQPAVPGEAQWRKNKPCARPRLAVFSPWLLPALLKSEASSVMGLVSAEAGWCAGFRMCVKHHFIFRVTFPSWVWLGSSKIMSSNYFLSLLTKPACIEKRQKLPNKAEPAHGHSPTNQVIFVWICSTSKKKNKPLKNCTATIVI